MNTARLIVLITALGAGEVAAYPARASDNNSLPAAPFAQLTTSMSNEQASKQDTSIDMALRAVLSPMTTDVNKGCPT